MKTFEEAIRLALAVYDDFQAKGLSKDEARTKAVTEMIERYGDMELVHRTAAVRRGTAYDK